MRIVVMCGPNPVMIQLLDVQMTSAWDIGFLMARVGGHDGCHGWNEANQLPEIESQSYPKIWSLI